MTRLSFLKNELDFEKRIFKTRPLSVFRRNPSTWELLLYLAQFEEGSEDGVYNTLLRLETQYLGNSAMLKFVRERRDDGSLIFTEHKKRSKWKIVLSESLREALISTIEYRNSRLLESFGHGDNAVPPVVGNHHSHKAGGAQQRSG